MKLDKFADFPLKQFESNCENNEKKTGHLPKNGEILGESRNLVTSEKW